MKTLIMFPGKGLMDSLTSYEDPPLTRAVVNAFFEACLLATRMKQTPDWERFFSAWARETYVKVAICGSAGNVVDHTTGCVVPEAFGSVYRASDEYFDNWYVRYEELLGLLNYYYRTDVIAAIRRVSEFGSVSSMYYITHNAYYIAAEINYVQLLTHNPNA